MQKKCKFAKQCSGCQLQNMDYSTQLEWKQHKLRRLFGGYGTVPPIIGMELPTHYRNKSQYSFRQDRSKKIMPGIYQSKTRSVTPVQNCLLDQTSAGLIANTAAKLIQSFKLRVYDYHQKTGFIRHILIRTGHYTGEIMVVLVVASPVFPKKQQFVNALLKRHPEITTIVLSISESEKMVLGKRQEVLYGSGYIQDKMMEHEFCISPTSFYQVNTTQAERLYQWTLEHMGLKKTDLFLDAYCGTGTIGLCAANQVNRVIGVEQNADAVQDAKENAARNQINNASFLCADAADFMKEYAAAGRQADVVLLDPPRAGSSIKCLHALLRLRPRIIAYISCNPETQLRDIRVLTKGAYQVQNMQGFDLFPWTNHIEHVVILSHTK